MNMTVKQLKEYLNQFDDNLKVFVIDWQEEYAPPAEVQYEEKLKKERIRSIP